jgi:hypothetical protein
MQYHKDSSRGSIQGQLLLFLSTFSQYQCFHVCFSSVPSDLYHQENGEPQWSVLSANLLAVMITGMVNALGLSVSALLYVSDTAIYYSSGSMMIIGHQLQIAVNHLSHWALQMTHFFSSHQRPSMYASCNCGVYILPTVSSSRTVYCHLLQPSSFYAFLTMLSRESHMWWLHIK